MSKRHTSGFLVLLALICALSGPGITSAREGAQAQESLQLRHPGTGALLWQAADQLVGPEGAWLTDELPEQVRVRRTQLEESFDRALRNNSGTAATDCYRVTVPLRGSLGHGGGDPSSLDEMVDYARAIVHGTVLEARGGFLLGDAGILLTVRVRRWVREFSGVPAADTLSVFYPVGEFNLGPVRLCKIGSAWPEPPSAGAELLLFLQDEPVAPSTDLIALRGHGTEIVFSDARGLHAPRALHDVPALLEGTTTLELRRRASRLARTRSEQR